MVSRHGESQTSSLRLSVRRAGALPSRLPHRAFIRPRPALGDAEPTRNL